MAEEVVNTTREINRILNKQIESSKAVRIGGLDAHDHIAIAISKAVKITVDGDAGDYFGALNNGANLRLNGKAGRFLGDNMFDGEIVVDGDVDAGAGAYLRGGTVVVKGGASGDVGGGMAGGTILVDGEVGDGVGKLMTGGSIVITGDVGRYVGAGMRGGALFIGGQMDRLGRAVTIVDMTDEERKTLASLFDRYDIDANLALFEKVVLETKKVGTTLSGEVRVA